MSFHLRIRLAMLNVLSGPVCLGTRRENGRSIWSTKPWNVRMLFGSVDGNTYVSATSSRFSSQTLITTHGKAGHSCRLFDRYRFLVFDTFLAIFVCFCRDFFSFACMLLSPPLFFTISLCTVSTSGDNLVKGIIFCGQYSGFLDILQEVIDCSPWHGTHKLVNRISVTECNDGREAPDLRG